MIKTGSVGGESVLKWITSGVFTVMYVHSSILFAMQKNIKETIISNCQTMDSSFPIVKELSEFKGGNYSNRKLSFMF